MSSAQPNNSRRAVMLTADAVRRINRAVARYERGDRDLSRKTRTAYDEGGGGAAVRLCKTTAVWEPHTTATLDIWEDGDTPDETQTADQTIDATNHSHKVAAGVWVIVAQAENGTWYLVEAGDQDATGEGGSCKPPSIGGADLTGLPGYDAAKKQALTHDTGCLAWVNIEDCPTEPPA